MNIFIVADQNGVVQALTYSFAEALEKAQIDWPVTEHELPPLIDLIAPYFTHRKLVTPNAENACLFLVSEVGELADALVSNRQEWVRNNPEKHKDLAGEIGDVLICWS